MSETSLVPTPPKIPLTIATNQIEYMVEAIEDGLTVTPPEFELARDQFQDACDRRIMHFRILESKIDMLKELKRQVNAKIQAAETALESLEIHTTGLIQQHPELTFEGRMGKLKLQRKPGVAAIEWQPHTLYEARSWTVYPGILEMASYLKPYITPPVIDVFDKKRFEDDMRAGRVTPAEMIVKIQANGTILRVK